MLVVLEAAGMLVNRAASEWHLGPRGPQHQLRRRRSPVFQTSAPGARPGRRLRRRPPLEAAEIIQLFGQLTLHQQAALIRLISRNLIIKTGDEDYMGYEFDYNVDGAMIAC